MLTITPSAVEGLLETLRQKGEAPDTGLRLSVERGGCAGLQYAMEIGDQREGDIVVKEGAAHIFVDPESAGYLEGCTLDYTDDLTGAGFRVLNPRATRSCGCGTSFEPSQS